jgi:tetratricopeptide (TPR) repeat protein
MEQDLEELHRQASGHYLKGDFPAAMAAWRKVLEIKPDDERGREGIRLCEQLEGCVEDGITTEPEPVAPPSAEPAAPPSAEPAAPPSAEPAAPPLAESAAPAHDADPPLDQVVADELRKRIDDLLVEARALLEQSDQDGALRTIERVLILDEENAEALGLRDSLEAANAEPQPEPEPVDAEPAPGGPEAPDEDESFILRGSDGIAPLVLSEDDESPGGVPAEAQPESVATDPGQPEEAPIEAGPPVFLESEVTDEESTDDESEPSVEPPAKPAAKKGSPPWLRDRRVMLGAGGVLAVVAVLVTLQMLSGGDAPTTDIATPSNTPDLPAAGTDSPADPATAPNPQTAPVARDPEDLMREAEAAFESEDYAAAVIAYDLLLKQHPHLTEVKVKMKVAAERYREQKARQKKWDDAAEAFRQESYAEALRLFYRMPNEEYAADIDRLKVNGWYNLGVLALQTKDCSRAIEHLDEARAIAPDDTGVLGVLELAELCTGPAVVADPFPLFPSSDGSGGGR